LSDREVSRSESERLALLLSQAQISERKKQRALALITAGPLSSPSSGLGPQSAPLDRLRVATISRTAVGFIAAHLAQYVLWLASWIILGRVAIEDRFNQAWFWAWAFVLFAIIPFRLLATWLQGLISVDMGGFLKAKLLCGVLKLNPDELRSCGLGSFLSYVLEAEVIETLAFTSGMGGLLAAMELIVAASILGRYAMVLLLWLLLAAMGAGILLFRYRRWTETRLKMTERIVEFMVGHRTRLAQQSLQGREEEAESFDDYESCSRRLDRVSAVISAVVSRGWLCLGIASLVPSFALGKRLSPKTAIALGGVLLAYGAFKRLSGALYELVAASVAWKRTSPLFCAAARSVDIGQCRQVIMGKASNNLIEAEGLSFRYAGSSNAVLKDLYLRIKSGERILLEGKSGDGKSTLASILAGLRQPQSGSLRANGVDLHTLGPADWCKCVAAAPQFHENYILTAPLAFNLLMGRGWPPDRASLEEAETVCRELGLGDLLDRMPAGLYQMVGEGGWQLSHGERSRIYIARALLQRAELVILDENFAALDPDTLHTALACVLNRAKTLMVIVHP
jgi:ATP-binding cassette subfamily B protein